MEQLILNELVNITVMSKIGQLNTLSGWAFTISNTSFIFLDQDKNEHVFKISDLVNVEKIIL